MSTLKRTILDWSLTIIAWIGMFNFIAFMIIGGSLGGIAWAGYVEGDSYYLGNRGSYTLVSESVYRFSQIYSFVSVVAFILMVISTFLHARLFSKK